MEFITFNNGMEMPVLGYGTYRTPSQIAEQCITMGSKALIEGTLWKGILSEMISVCILAVVFLSAEPIVRRSPRRRLTARWPRLWHLTGQSGTRAA